MELFEVELTHNDEEKEVWYVQCLDTAMADKLVLQEIGYDSRDVAMSIKHVDPDSLDEGLAGLVDREFKENVPVRWL